MEVEIEKGKQYWNVAVNTPLKNLFTYLSPEDIHLEPGQSVKVPFGRGNRKISGLVVEKAFPDQEKKFEIKKIFKRDEERPFLNEKSLKWLKWISDYYLHPLGQVQNLIYPPLKKNSGRKSRKTPLVSKTIPRDQFSLTKQQERVLSEIQLENFKVYLLYGVTGSGKN